MKEAAGHKAVTGTGLVQLKLYLFNQGCGPGKLSALKPQTAFEKVPGAVGWLDGKKGVEARNLIQVLRWNPEPFGPENDVGKNEAAVVSVAVGDPAVYKVDIPRDGSLFK